jgi:hypothetical protein
MNKGPITRNDIIIGDDHPCFWYEYMLRDKSRRLKPMTRIKRPMTSKSLK